MLLRQTVSLTALAAAMLVGCSGGSGSSGSPSTSLSISLMDAPVDGVTAVFVKITAIWLKPQGAGPAVQLPLANGPRTVNLLALTDTNAAVLVDDAAVEPGNYEWLAMDVSAEHDGVMDSYVTTSGGGQFDLRVPSGRVRLVSGFTVEANQATQYLFDWDMRQGLVAPPGLSGYLLKPAFRMLDVTEYGVLKGSVAGTTVTNVANDCDADGANLDAGNVVYVFNSTDVVDDIDGTGDPIATANVTPVAGSPDYAYRVLLQPGTYKVAFTCQAVNDKAPEDPTTTPEGETIGFLPSIPPEAANVTMAGNTQTVNF